MIRALLIVALAMPLLAAGQPQEPLFNLVHLQGQAEREVPNDLLTAVLAAEAEGPDPAKLADGINRTMQRALTTAHEYKSVTSRTGSYQTYPTYDKARVVRWRVRQELRLESTAFAAVTELIGKLQADLIVAGMSFSVSGDARRKAENALMVEAIAAFEERARVVRDAMKAKGYRVQQMQVSPSGAPPVRPMAAMARGMSAEAVAPPAIEPGSSRILITVSGTVQLQ